MTQPRVEREEVLRALQMALEPLPYVHAMWQGGAAAFQRVDQWSDIDLQVDVDDDRVPDVFAAVEATLNQISAIDLRYDIPQPSWHGHAQTFYRLRDASPFLMIDFVAIQHSNPNKFIQPPIHGQAVVHFDKSHVTRPPAFDRESWLSKLKSRVATLQSTFELFQPLTLKEIHRGNHIEAMGFFMNMTLRPLVEALRITYSPTHFDFNTRYVYYDLPEVVIQRLEPLFFIGNPGDLAARHHEAVAFFTETISQIDWQAIEEKLASA